MKPMPTWLKIGIPILILVVVLVAALVALVTEEVPDHAQPDVLEARFGEQLAFLRELAADLPFEGCRERSREEILDHIEMLEVWQERLKVWKEKVAAGEHLFKDPVILAAEILEFCDGAQSTFQVKPYEGPESTWSPAMLSRREEWPVATLWFAGTKRQVRYDSQVEAGNSDSLIIRLILDLETL